jgi:ribosomal-protein-alanine N-acetyltransferase
MSALDRLKGFLHAVLPPFVISALRWVRRRPRVQGTALSSPVVPLTDGVVELRPINKRDLELIERGARDPEIRREFTLLRLKPSRYLARYRKASREKCAAALAICDPGGECFGLVTAEAHERGRVELGYWMLPEARGRGRAKRAVRLVSLWALSQPGVSRLQLATSPENTASQRVAERNGFQREGVLRSYNVVNGRREDAVFFSLLPGDLEERAGRGSGHLALLLGLFVDQREILEFGSVALGLVGNL